MLKRIKVQKKLNIATATLLSALVALIAVIFIYLSITSEFVSVHTRYQIYGFIGMTAIFIPLWLNNAKLTDEYVSEIIIDEKILTVIYKRGKTERTSKIFLDDIESVDVLLNANNVKTGNTISLFCETIVSIKIKNGQTIFFTENPTASFSFCNYAFMLRLLDISKYLPNFTFQVNGNSEVAKLDVENYALKGKRLSYLKREFIAFKQYPIALRILLIFCLVPALCGVWFLIYLNFPTFLNNTDKQYLSHIEKGYSYFQNRLYDKSLLEYDKALNIHDNDSALYYYRALTYHYNRQYEKAIQEAQKGLDLLSQKSVYYKAKNLKFMNSEIGLYTILGKSEGKLKNYHKAISAYDYVVNNVKYKYTDAYYQRGICKYYLNQKTAALKDFIHHKRIIQNYLENQAQSEYKAKYPTYTYDNLKDIEEWIRACQ